MKNITPVATDVFDRRAAHRFVANYLSTALPPPADDTPEVRCQQDRDAEAPVAALKPANEAEAMLAAQFVAASAQALDCLRLAHLPDSDAATHRQCTAQSATMMRQSQAALRALSRMQSQRELLQPKQAATVAAPRTVAPPPPRAPEKPKPAIPPASAATRAMLPGLPSGPLAGQRSGDRMLDELLATAMRQSPGNRDFETVMRRSGR